MDEIKVPTVEEVRQRFLDRKEQDLFGFEALEYLEFAGFDWIKNQDLFREDATYTDEEKAGFNHSIVREDIIARMKGYMSFAFEKANGERGISSNRSIMHYIAWTWLAGDAEFSAEINHDLELSYNGYGKPILKKICEHYGWDSKEFIS